MGDNVNESIWHNLTCPALLLAAIILLSKALNGIRASMDALREAVNRLPPPAQTPYQPPQRPAAPLP
jgi:hypothetical protein